MRKRVLNRIDEIENDDLLNQDVKSNQKRIILNSSKVVDFDIFEQEEFLQED